MTSASEVTLAVAETDTAARDSLVRALKNDFKLVIAAKPGSGKTDLLVRSKLIIYDLNLGLHDLKRLRKNHPEIPIMVISPKVPPPTLNRALELDMTDFITKPIDTKELRIRVNHCLRRWHFVPRSMARQARTKEVAAPASSGHKRAGPIEISLPQLHSNSGRLSAWMIAEFLNVPLSELAESLHVNYTTLHKTPDSPSAQANLAPLKRILVILTEMLGDQKAVRAWLNSPHPDLGQRSPISLLVSGHADAVLTILENALVGVPG